MKFLTYYLHARKMHKTQTFSTTESKNKNQGLNQELK